jgi:hypothetical protein
LGNQKVLVKTENAPLTLTDEAGGKEKTCFKCRDLNVSFVRHYAHNAALLNKKSTKKLNCQYFWKYQIEQNHNPGGNSKQFY